MLDDLVGCLVGTATNDPGVLAGLVTLDGDGILADILEPDKVQGAGYVISLSVALDSGERLTR